MTLLALLPMNLGAELLKGGVYLFGCHLPLMDRGCNVCNVPGHNRIHLAAVQGFY